MRYIRHLPLFLLLFTAAPVAAQQQVRIQGRVISNESERPLPGAEVTLRRRDGTFLKKLAADSLGKFEFVVSRQAGVRIQAQHIGYKTNTTPVLYFDRHRFIEVEVRLDTEAILLAPLEVIVWSDVDRSPLLDNFRQRRSTGFGTYITRKDIEARRPMYTSDLLRTVPGIELIREGTGTRPRIELARGAGRWCRTQIFVDGMLMNRQGPGPEIDVRLDDLVSPGSIEGIEIYKGLSSIPPEFLNADSQCGVIAVWTRRGGTGEASR
jgi:hypothetical protein